MPYVFAWRAPAVADVENLADLPPEPVLDPASLAHVLQRRMPLYDRQQEAHYNLISALHKSVRGSDPDAALYWLARMLAGGEDPRYIARRLVRMASEDIGLADPSALPLAIAASQAYEQLGSPEGELALAHGIVNCSYVPVTLSREDAIRGGEFERLRRDLKSRLMRSLGGLAERAPGTFHEIIAAQLPAVAPISSPLASRPAIYSDAQVEGLPIPLYAPGSEADREVRKVTQELLAALGMDA